MRLAMLLSLALLAGCASAPKSTFEQIGLRVAREGVPSCEPGHEGALVGGAVTIRPGQTICLALQVHGSSVLPVAVVPSGSKENVLILGFSREPDSNAAVLTVHNPLGTFLRYKAHMLRPGSSGYEYTSSCPVLSNRLGIEHWPHTITELLLSDFESLPDSATITCQ